MLDSHQFLTKHCDWISDLSPASLSDQLPLTPDSDPYSDYDSLVPFCCYLQILTWLRIRACGMRPDSHVTIPALDGLLS